MSETVVVERATAPAVLESNISVEHVYSHEKNIDFKGTKYDGDFSSLLESEIKGFGRVDLIEIVFKVIGTAASQSFLAGLSAVGSGATAKQLAGTQTGFKYYSSSYTIGVEKTVSLIPPDYCSRQIRPTSADLPMLRLAMERSGDIEVTLTVRYKVRGICVTYASLN